ncbi:MAG: hypothetical protein IPN95_27995 [Bacteroidetes bacterium]|nr:hypothetical protein [Bacteroidota bacterium]
MCFKGKAIQNLRWKDESWRFLDAEKFTVWKTIKITGQRFEIEVAIMSCSQL